MNKATAVCMGIVCLFGAAAAGVRSQQTAPRQFGPPPELARIAGIAGEWEIEMVHPASSGQSESVAKTSSKIGPILGGAHFQEWNWVPVNGKPVHMTALWSYDRYRKVYRMAYLDDMHALFDPHEGVWEGDRLVLTNVRTGTWLPASGGRKSYSRITVHSITTNRFTLEYDASLDEGKTWTRQLNCTYTRKALSRGVNPAIPPSPKAAASFLQRFVGDWRVRGEQFGTQGASEPFETTASAKRILGDAYLEERLTLPGQPANVDLIFVTGYDRFQKIFRSSVFDSLSGLVDVYEGGWDGADALVLSNLKPDTHFTTASGKKVYGRVRVEFSGEDEFVRSYEVREEGAEAWTPVMRATYSRRR